MKSIILAMKLFLDRSKHRIKIFKKLLIESPLEPVKNYLHQRHEEKELQKIKSQKNTILDRLFYDYTKMSIACLGYLHGMYPDELEPLDEELDIQKEIALFNEVKEQHLESVSKLLRVLDNEESLKLLEDIKKHVSAFNIEKIRYVKDVENFGVKGYQLVNKIQFIENEKNRK